MSVDDDKDKKAWGGVIERVEGVGARESVEQKPCDSRGWRVFLSRRKIATLLILAVFIHDRYQKRGDYIEFGKDMLGAAEDVFRGVQKFDSRAQIRDKKKAGLLAARDQIDSMLDGINEPALPSAPVPIPTEDPRRHYNNDYGLYTSNGQSQIIRDPSHKRCYVTTGVTFTADQLLALDRRKDIRQNCTFPFPMSGSYNRMFSYPGGIDDIVDFAHLRADPSTIKIDPQLAPFYVSYIPSNRVARVLKELDIGGDHSHTNDRSSWRLLEAVAREGSEEEKRTVVAAISFRYDILDTLKLPLTPPIPPGLSPQLTLALKDPMTIAAKVVGIRNGWISLDSGKLTETVRIRNLCKDKGTGVGQSVDCILNSVNLETLTAAERGKLAYYLCLRNAPSEAIINELSVRGGRETVVKACAGFEFTGKPIVPLACAALTRESIVAEVKKMRDEKEAKGKISNP